MKHQHPNAGTPSANMGISLQILISSTIGHLTGIVNANKITVLNHVSAELRIYLVQREVATVIYDMMATILSNARNTVISITAEKFRDIIIVSVEDRNNYNGYALSFSLMAIEEEAKMAGGTLSMKDVQKKVATISFSFPNIALA